MVGGGNDSESDDVYLKICMNCVCCTSDDKKGWWEERKAATSVRQLFCFNSFTIPR